MADPDSSPPLSRASVLAAHDIIRPFVHLTPVLTNSTLNKLASTPRETATGGQDGDHGGVSVGEGHDDNETKTAPPARPRFRLWFKCENLQRVGAFKVRGAFHAVERLKREEGFVEGGGLAKGVVTHSSGNHAQALALAARESGMPAHIVMPSISPANKVAATKGYGAHVIFSGSTSVEREAVADKVIAETGARLVPPYDHPDIILGQGTMGIELQSQVEDMISQNRGPSLPSTKKKRGLDAIITPVGGGGMLAGVALSAEGTGTSVFGAEPSFQGADDCARGLAAGQRIEAVSTLTIADGLRTPVGLHNWGVIHDRGLVRAVYAVSEDEIRAALRLVLERMKMVVEPSAAVPLAVVLFNESFRALVEREGGEDGWDVGVVLSGGNVGVEMLASLFPPPRKEGKVRGKKE